MHPIERVAGKATGRSRSSAYGDLVWTVATAMNPAQDIEMQTAETLATLESNLASLGSNKRRMISAQVFLSNIADKGRVDDMWCRWIGDDPEQWPQRACFGVSLEGTLLIEITVVAARS
jgi:enamine deaminase RidA (YjgF/YER057c/UK114 family)